MSYNLHERLARASHCMYRALEGHRKHYFFGSYAGGRVQLFAALGGIR